MANINMDNKKNPQSIVPQLEFTIPMSEVDEVVEVGQVGTVEIPVEVVSVTKDEVVFRKRGKTRIPVGFKEVQLQDLEAEIGLGER